MSENSNEVSSKEVKEREQLSLIQRLVYIFTNPSRVFEDIKENPNTLLPMIIISIITAVGVIIAFTTPNPQITQEARESMRGMLIAMSIIGGIFGIAIIFGIVALQALVINGVSTLFGGEQTQFKKVFSSLLYASIPASVGGMILLLIGFAVESGTAINASISVLMPESMSKTFIYILLSQISAFSIWNQILNIIGISKVNSLSKKNATIITLIIWLVIILISSAFTLISINKSAGL